MIRRLVLVVIAGLLASAGCSSASGPPTPHPTLRLATPTPMPSDSVPPSAEPSGPPLASAQPYPDAAERTLLAHLRSPVSLTCARSGPFYSTELASVSCGDGRNVPYVDYSLFGSVADLNAAFEGDISTAPQQPVASGSCADGHFLEHYDLAGVREGQIWCTTRSDANGTYRVIEWTRESLPAIGVITGTGQSWADLLTFWRTQAGPFA